MFWKQKRALKRQEIARLEQNKAVALDYANAVRSEFMLPPLTEMPKGLLGASQGCPMANALKGDDLQVSASRDGIWVTILPISYIPRTRLIEIPAEVKSFIGDFDQQKYPELIAR